MTDITRDQMPTEWAHAEAGPQGIVTPDSARQVAAALRAARFTAPASPGESPHDALLELAASTIDRLLDEDGAAHVVISNTDPTAEERLRRFVKLREQASLSDWGPGPDLDTEGARIDTAGDHTGGQ